ncbi:hypothetical protein AGMMS4952_19460 [Spirochaetia bacterium]|nr:hypothetical protein AGMMS4952_19460 [Spirochaetia bacterium]
MLATEVMSTAQMMDSARIYEKVRHEMANPPVMYFAHIPGIFDEYIINTVKAEGIDIPHDYVWQGGIGVAKKIDALIRDHNFSIGFCSGGARGLHHFTEMVGARCSITINWGGTADKLLQLDEPVVQRFPGPVPQGVLDALSYKIPDFRKAYDLQGLSPKDYENFGPVKLFRSNFEDAWRKTLGLIQKRRTQ